MQYKIKLLGDHSNTHSGCSAVIEYLNSIFIERHTLTLDKNNNDYDILVMNGEGSMHHNSKSSQKKMEQLRIAQQSNKKTFLINSVWQQNNSLYQDVLKKLDGIIVREGLSQLDLEKNHGIKATVRIDASYFNIIKPLGAHCNYNNEIILTDFFSESFGCWVKYTKGGYANQPYLDMSECTWPYLVRSLKTARMLITGRHHAVFAACKAKIPFVALESNSHKISGLIYSSGFSIPIVKNPRLIAKNVKWALNNKELYQDFFAWLDEQPKLMLKDLSL